MTVSLDSSDHQSNHSSSYSHISHNAIQLLIVQMPPLREDQNVWSLKTTDPPYDYQFEDQPTGFTVVETTHAMPYNGLLNSLLNTL